MKTIIHRLTAILPLAVGLCTISCAEESPQLTDPGWPREHVLENKKLTVYQPQVDEWKDHSIMHFRCAIEVEGVLKEPTFGVAEIEARTLVESETRTVKLFTTKRDYRFSGVSEDDKKSLLAAMDLLSPPERLITVSLDRVLTFLDADSAAVQKQVDVNLDPPKIFYSEKPAVLVIFMGEPQFKPVVARSAGPHVRAQHELGRLLRTLQPGIFPAQRRPLAHQQIRRRPVDGRHHPAREVEQSPE